MAPSRPSAFPPSNSIIRPPENSKPEVVNSSTIFSSVNLDGDGNSAGSHRNRNHNRVGISRLSKSTLGDRRARPPLRIDSRSISAEEPREQGGKTPVAFHAPSAPIPIPDRQKSTRPTTPLTARESKGGHCFPFITLSPPESTPRKNGWEDYQQHRASGSASASAAAPAPVTDRPHHPPQTPKTAPKAPNVHHQSRPHRHPAMPLSPLQPMNQNPHLPHRAGKNMHLASLPRFHPANYQSAESGSIATHRGPRSSVPQRQGSEASQQLHQYRRALVDSASMAARSLMSPNLSKPSPPRLHPLGSPGPVTPLVLEGQDDYLMGGSATSPRSFTAKEGSELVDRLIREEHDRNTHPGIRSARHSPAVSPAGGRG